MSLPTWKHGGVIGTTSSESTAGPAGLTSVRTPRQLDWYEKCRIPGALRPLGRFGLVPMATSLPQFIKIAQAIARNADHNGICGWRGQANAEWRVESGAARRVQKPWLEHFGRDREIVQEVLEKLGAKTAREAIAGSPGSSQHADAVRGYERLMLNQARVNGFGHHDGRRLSDLELLANLQHHGAATNLLDVTKNLLVALWMASSEPEFDNKPGVVIAFGQSALWTTDDATAQLPLLEWMRLPGAGTRTTKYWIPSKLNLRIVAQSGFFVLSPIVDEPWGALDLRGTVIWDTEETAHIDDPDCYFIGVSRRLKEEMRDAQKYGLFPYAQNTIYPDLPGFADYHSARRDVPFFA